MGARDILAIARRYATLSEGGVFRYWLMRSWAPGPKLLFVMLILRRSGKPVQCLRITRSGFPQHPLYLPSDCRLHVWDEAAIQEAMG